MRMSVQRAWIPSPRPALGPIQGQTREKMARSIWGDTVSLRAWMPPGDATFSRGHRVGGDVWTQGCADRSHECHRTCLAHPPVPVLERVPDGDRSAGVPGTWHPPRPPCLELALGSRSPPRVGRQIPVCPLGSQPGHPPASLRLSDLSHTGWPRPRWLRPGLAT